MFAEMAAGGKPSTETTALSSQKRGFHQGGFGGKKGTKAFILRGKRTLPSRSSSVGVWGGKKKRSALRGREGEWGVRPLGKEGGPCLKGKKSAKKNDYIRPKRRRSLPRWKTDSDGEGSTTIRRESFPVAKKVKKQGRRTKERSRGRAGFIVQGKRGGKKEKKRARRKKWGPGGKDTDISPVGEKRKTQVKKGQIRGCRAKKKRT